MTVDTFTTSQSRTDFFQECIVRMIEYWQEHEAVKRLQIAVLDRERDAILKVISLALDFTPAWSLVRGLIVAFTRYMERRGHWEVWNTVLHRAIKVATQQGDVEGETTLCLLVARLSQRRSDFDSVVYFYRRVIQLARKSGNRYEEARACCNLGYYYIDAAYWWRSEVLSYHALKVFEELESDHGLAHTHNHLGLLYTRRRMWQNAEQNLAAACEIWNRMSDQYGLMRGYGNLGALYCDMADADRAIHYSMLAFQSSEQTGDEALSGIFLLNLTIGHRLQGKQQRAIEYGRRAERIFQQYGDRLGLAQIWHQLGLVYLQCNLLLEAEHFKVNALTLYEQLDSTHQKEQLLADFREYDQHR